MVPVVLVPFSPVDQPQLWMQSVIGGSFFNYWFEDTPRRTQCDHLHLQLHQLWLLKSIFLLRRNAIVDAVVYLFIIIILIFCGDFVMKFLSVKEKNE